MTTDRKRTLKGMGTGSVDDWPSLALLEFTTGLARMMKARAKPMNQAQLARAMEVSAPYISSVMAGNENLSIEQMSRLAAAVDCTIHIAVVKKDLRVRWIEDTLESTADRCRSSAGEPLTTARPAGATPRDRRCRASEVDEPHSVAQDPQDLAGGELEPRSVV
jgi:transcriptional regulator with XRE-family HTH domain